MNFEEASTRYMEVFGEPEKIIRPAGVKLIPKGQEVPEGTCPPEDGMVK